MITRVLVVRGRAGVRPSHVTVATKTSRFRVHDLQFCEIRHVVEPRSGIAFPPTKGQPVSVGRHSPRPASQVMP